MNAKSSKRPYSKPVLAKSAVLQQVTATKKVSGDYKIEN